MIVMIDADFLISVNHDHPDCNTSKMLNKFMNPLKIKPLLIAVASLSALSLLSCKQGETSEPVPRMLTTFASSATHSAGGKHALLIGIQEYNYVQTGFHSLKGPLNDINLTKGMLGQR